MENSERGNVPELKVIASPALMKRLRALKEEKEVLKKGAVNTTKNKRQGLNSWNEQGLSDILRASIADSNTYGKKSIIFNISKVLGRIMLYSHCLYQRK